MFTKKMSARTLTVGGAIALALGAVSGTQAATETADLNVSATVTATCVVSTTPVAFGAYDPLGTHASAPNHANGSVVVQCSDNTAATVTLDQGDTPDAASTDAAPLRQMASGTDRLPYQLFSEGTWTTVWGNTEATGVDHTSDGSQVSLTVYGEIDAGLNVAAGDYADIVEATVTF